jgi:hypothetical protein
VRCSASPNFDVVVRRDKSVGFIAGRVVVAFATSILRVRKFPSMTTVCGSLRTLRFRSRERPARVSLWKLGSRGERNAGLPFDDRWCVGFRTCTAS